MTSTHHTCFVPGCPSTYQTTPKKVFFPVPNKTYRKQWFEAIGQPLPASKKTLHCCEDHFNLEEDTENYIKFKVMDGTILKLKKGIVPHIFKQQNSPVERTFLVTCDDEKNIDIKEEQVDSDFEDDVSIKKPRLDSYEEEALPETKPQIVEVYVTDVNFTGVPKQSPKTSNGKVLKHKKVRSVGVQVNLRPPHRSIGIMAKLEMDDCSDGVEHCLISSEEIKKELYYDENCEEIDAETELEFSYGDAGEIKIENTDLSEIKVEKTEVDDDGEIS